MCYVNKFSENKQQNKNNCKRNPVMRCNFQEKIGKKKEPISVWLLNRTETLNRLKLPSPLNKIQQVFPRTVNRDSKNIGY